MEIKFNTGELLTNGIGVFFDGHVLGVLGDDYSFGA